MFVPVAEGFDQLAAVVMVRHDGLDVETEVAVARTGEKVGQAVDRLGHHDRCAWLPGKFVQRISHRVLLGHRAKGRGEEVEVPGAVVGELDALEEHRIVVVGVLLGVHDVAAVHRHPRRHISDDPRSVRTRDTKREQQLI